MKWRFVIADDSYDISTPSPLQSVDHFQCAPANLNIPGDPRRSLSQQQRLVCEMLTPATDIDGDSLTYTVNWLRNGAPTLAVVPRRAQRYTQGDTIPANMTENGDVWTCALEVTDSIGTRYATLKRPSTAGFEYGNSTNCPALSCKDILDNDPSLYGFDGGYFIKPASDTFSSLLRHDL